MNKKLSFLLICTIALSLLLSSCSGGSLNLKTMVPIAEKNYIEDESESNSEEEKPAPVNPTNPTNPSVPVVDRDPEYITFGEYPTSVVDTSSQLYQDLLDCYRYGTNTFEKTTIRIDNVNYEYYTDGTVKYFSYLTVDVGSATANGYVKDAVYFFVVEPIKWRILDETPNGYFVMAENIIDGYCFDLQRFSTNWENCSLRTYLNNNFYNLAFTASERNKIVKSDVVNKGVAYSVYEPLQGSNTVDNIFLLSYADCFNSDYGFLVSTTTADAAKQAKTSDYAKARGVLTSKDTQFYNNGEWWTRSTGFSKSTAASIDVGGCIHFMGGYVIVYYGIRPAMVLSTSVKKDSQV